MDTQTLVALGMVALVAAGLVYISVSSFLRTLRNRRKHRLITESGVSTHGVVSRVHPLERSYGHTVTVTVRDPHGYQWDAVDSTGLSGYLLREGTPVELLYVPAEPHMVRIERAAHPDPAGGSYPVHPHHQPGQSYSWVLPLLPAAGILVVAPVFLAAILGEGGVPALLIPFLFVIFGLILVVGAVVSMVRIRLKTQRHTGTTTGTITDTWVKRHHSRSSRSSGSRRTYPFTVHFGSWDGREVHGLNQTSSSTYIPTVGEPVTVRYDPEHPASFAVSGTTLNPAFGGCVTLALGVGLIVLGSLLGLAFAVG